MRRCSKCHRPVKYHGKPWGKTCARTPETPIERHLRESCSEFRAALDRMLYEVK